MDTESVFSQFFGACWDPKKHERKTYWNIKRWNVKTRFFFSEYQLVLDQKDARIQAAKCLVPFATSYLCELGVSSDEIAIKTKVRNFLKIENNFIVSISNTESMHMSLL